MSLTERCLRFSSETTDIQSATNKAVVSKWVFKIDRTQLSDSTVCRQDSCQACFIHMRFEMVVSSHFRRCLPFTDICFDMQPLLSPDILLKMLEPAILFRTLNLNQSHSDLGSNGNSPDLRQHTPYSEKPDWRLAARLRLSRWPYDVYLTPWRGIFHPDQDSMAQSLTLGSDASNRPMATGSRLAFSLLISSILCLNTVINLIMTVSGSSSLV